MRLGSDRGPLAILLVLGATLSVSARAGADNYKVGVYYFGVWSEANCNVCSPSITDPWTGPRHYYDGTFQSDPTVCPAAPWCGETFPQLKPALDFYSNSNPDIIAAQIRQARANGVDFFNFYWYWKNDENGGQGDEKFSYIDEFLSVQQTYEMPFAISVCSHPWGNLDIPASQGTTAVDTIVTKYLIQPHYLKVAGRPVVFFIDTRGIKGGSHSDVVDFLALLDQEVQLYMGVEPFIVIDFFLDGAEGIGHDPDVLRVNDLLAVDGHSCHSGYGLSLDGDPYLGSHFTYNSRLLTSLEQWNTKPMIPCYMTAFDERCQTELHDWRTWQELRYLTDWSTSSMSSGLSGVKAFSDSHSAGLVDNWINLYAWNEWNEAGHLLEPNDYDGNQNLAVVAAVLQLDTFGSQSCKDFGDCPESVAAPLGTLDLATCDSIEGWAKDPDSALPTEVHIYKGPYVPGGPDPVAIVTALLPRGGPGWPFPDINHGFVVRTPAQLLTGQPEQVYAYALNLGVNGNLLLTGAVQLSGAPITITCTGELFSDGFESGNTNAWSAVLP